jgi:hypothetical protein
LNRPDSFDIFKKLNLNEPDLRKKTATIGEKRIVKFTLFNKPDVKFGDGNFILNGYRGFNLASYEHVFLDKFSSILLGEDKFYLIKEKVANAYIEGTFDKKYSSKIISGEAIKQILKKLEIFGRGPLELHRYQRNQIIIKNTNNPYLEDYFALFGKLDNNLSIDMLSRLLRIAFEKYFNKKFEIKLSTKINVKENYFELSFNQ